MNPDNSNTALFIGRNLIELPQIESTNDYASSVLCHQTTPLPEGTLIIAHEQSAGKGQRGAIWRSEPGKNLTFSIVLFPVFLAAKDTFNLNKAIALGIADFIQTLCTDKIMIKWPNDIYCKDSKICGILIENTIRGANIQSSIIGIGLNVNQKEFSKSILNASSLYNCTQKNHDLNLILNGVCSAIERRYLQLKAGKIELLQKDYLLALYKYNIQTQFRAGSDVFSGKITGINENGNLEITLSTDEKKYFAMKEVAMVFS